MSAYCDSSGMHKGIVTHIAIVALNDSPLNFGSEGGVIIIKVSWYILKRRN